MNRYAMDVVRECAEAWERLITGKAQPGEIALYAPSFICYLCLLTSLPVPTPASRAHQTESTPAVFRSHTARTSCPHQSTHPSTSGSSSLVLPSRCFHITTTFADRIAAPGLPPHLMNELGRIDSRLSKRGFFDIGNPLGD